MNTLWIFILLALMTMSIAARSNLSKEILPFCQREEDEHQKSSSRWPIRMRHLGVEGHASRKQDSRSRIEEGGCAIDGRGGQKQPRSR
jgi:hypothetical protein